MKGKSSVLYMHREELCEILSCLTFTTLLFIFCASSVLFSIPSKTIRTEFQLENIGAVDSLPGQKESGMNLKEAETLTKLDISGSELYVSIVVLGYNLYWDANHSPADRKISCPDHYSDAYVIYSNTLADAFRYNVTMFSHLFMEIRNFDNWQWLIQTKRKRHHRWIMFSLEPPVRVGLNTSAPSRTKNKFFHWTATYDPLSDFPIPYGRYITRRRRLKKFDSDDILAGKTHFTSFVSSNCENIRWPRADFVKAMQKKVPIDMYGKCGDLPCGTDQESCNIVQQRYKFTFALENAPCRGYITEKFWYALGLYKTVPVVWGGDQRDYLRVAPPNSFIHVSEFSSMEKLGDYLLYLYKNTSAYLEYHKWRQLGTVEVLKDWSTVPNDNTFCSIAKKYTQSKKSAKIKYRDVNGLDWMDTCIIHAIRPRGYINHFPIPES